MGSSSHPTRDQRAASIDAAISDGNGGALLVGDAGSQAWFRALDARGVVRSSTVLRIDAPIDTVDILPGHDDGERTGQPTWTRLLDHFRAFEIYGGAMYHDLRGTAHFVARIPITGEGQSALAWLKMSPGFDGVLVIRQLSGTVGWQRRGSSKGDDAAIAAYRQTDAGLEWKVLRIDTGYVWADSRR